MRRYLIFFFLLAFLPLVMNKPYPLHIAIVAIIYAIASVGWNIVAGFAGQLSFGHAAFFGLGAYTVALAANKIGLPPVAGIVVGGIIAGIAGVAIGYPCFRLRGPFYSLATLAFSESLVILFTHFVAFTGGMQGVTVPYKGVAPLWLQFDSKVEVYLIFLAILAVVMLAVYALDHSVFGLKMKAIREDQEAAESIGIDLTRTKLIAGGLSGFVTGLAGGLYASYIIIVDPNIAFGSAQCIVMVVYTIVGGLGSVAGPMVGSFILVPVTILLNSLLGSQGIKGVSMLGVGFLLLFIVMVWPSGLVGLWNKIELGLHDLRQSRARARRGEGG
jgi:branched-chain amino acid transport system permease protein